MQLFAVERSELENNFLLFSPVKTLRIDDKLTIFQVRF